MRSVAPCWSHGVGSGVCRLCTLPWGRPFMFRSPGRPVPRVFPHSRWEVFRSPWLWRFRPLIPSKILTSVRENTFAAFDQLQPRVISDRQHLLHLLQSEVHLSYVWLFETPWTAAPQASPSPEACSDLCPLSWWCHPTILSSVIPFSCLQSFPSPGSFPMSWLKCTKKPQLISYTQVWI